MSGIRPDIKQEPPQFLRTVGTWSHGPGVPARSIFTIDKYKRDNLKSHLVETRTFMGTNFSLDASTISVELSKVNIHIDHMYLEVALAEAPPTPHDIDDNEIGYSGPNKNKTRYLIEDAVPASQGGKTKYMNDKDEFLAVDTSSDNLYNTKSVSTVPEERLYFEDGQLINPTSTGTVPSTTASGVTTSHGLYQIVENNIVGRMMPLYNWFYFWDVDYVYDKGRRTLSTEYQYIKWCLLSTEEFRRECYLDGELGGATVNTSDILYNDQTVLSMRLYNTERFLNNFEMALATFEQNVFRINFALKPFSEYYYGADTETGSLFTTMSIQSASSSSTEFTERFALDVDGNISTQTTPISYKGKAFARVYTPINPPRLSYFRIRIIGELLSDSTIQLGKQMLKSGICVVDTEPYRFVTHIPVSDEEKDNTEDRHILNGCYGRVTGLIINFKPEQHYRPHLNSNGRPSANKFGYSLPERYATDGLRSIASNMEFSVGLAQNPFQLTANYVPGQLLKMGLSNGYGISSRVLPEIGYNEEHIEANAIGFVHRAWETTADRTLFSIVDDGVNNNINYARYHHMFMYSFPFCTEYGLSITGAEFGYLRVNGDLAFRLKNYGSLLRDIRGYYGYDVDNKDVSALGFDHQKNAAVFQFPKDANNTATAKINYFNVKGGDMFPGVEEQRCPVLVYGQHHSVYTKRNDNDRKSSFSVMVNTSTNQTEVDTGLFSGGGWSRIPTTNAYRTPVSTGGIPAAPSDAPARSFATSGFYSWAGYKALRDSGKYIEMEILAHQVKWFCLTENNLKKDTLYYAIPGTF